MRNILALILLIFIGVIVHYSSFSLSLYGDDWLFIYKYFTHYDPSFHINTMLPGIFAYLAPYGPSIFLIGTQYQIFGQNYFLYYLVALIFKIFASFTLVLVSKKITKSTLISMLVAILFLVGVTGVQTTDWVFYSNVYLATALFLIGLFFQISFLEDRRIKNLISHFIFSILAILVAPVRLYPLVFVIPIVDLIMLNSRGLNNRRFYFFKILFFILLIVFFWLVGVFGAPGGRIYSPGNWSISDFINFVNTQPLFTIKSFLYWIGTIFIPDSLISNQRQVALVGLVFLIVGVLTLLKNRWERKWVILSAVTFLIFFLTMWFFSPSRLIGSADRYLLPTFASGCLLLGILVKSLSETYALLKHLPYLALVILIFAHVNATMNIYVDLLSKGRDLSFAKIVDMQIRKDFPLPITQPIIVYLEADDESIKQSTIFGLAFRIAVLSNTWDTSFIPDPTDNKSILVKKVLDKINQGVAKDKVISSIYAYKVKGKDFMSIIGQIRDELANFLILNRDKF